MFKSDFEVSDADESANFEVTSRKRQLRSTYLPRETPRTRRPPRATRDRPSPYRFCCRSCLRTSHNKLLLGNFEVTRKIELLSNSLRVDDETSI